MYIHDVCTHTYTPAGIAVIVTAWGSHCIHVDKNGIKEKDCI